MYVRLSQYRKRIAFVPADGELGYVIGLHWSRWFLYWVTAGTLLLAVLVGGAFAYQEGWFGMVGSTGARAVYLGMSVLAGLIAFGWYWDLRQTFVLATPATVYESRVRKLIWNVDSSFPVMDASRFDSDVEGYGILGVRTLLYHGEGDRPDIELKHSSATQTDLDNLHRLIHS